MDRRVKPGDDKKGGPGMVRQRHRMV